MTSIAFSDPAVLAEQRESATCKGCAFEVRKLVSPGLAGIDAPVVMRCAGGSNHGIRCKRYMERECQSPRR